MPLLIIGAGGIGSELLKTMVLCAPPDDPIEIVDNDTVEVSNLNRQLFFRASDVGLRKVEALVTRVSASLRGPCRRILRPRFADITDRALGPAYYAAFDVVLMALDNVAARRHVNAMCLAAGTPLVDAGSGGWIGQARQLGGRAHACYDCEPRLEAGAEIPYCSIRSHPTRPEHAIAWALEAFRGVHGGRPRRDLDLGNGGPIEDLFPRTRRDHPLIAQLTAAGARVGHTGDAIAYCKDDAHHNAWIVLASRLRAREFAIALGSDEQIVTIAGRIVPAIATTNSIVAALAAHEAVKALRGVGRPRHAYLRQHVSRDAGFLLGTAPPAKASRCICRARVHRVAADDTTTIAELCHAIGGRGDEVALVQGTRLLFEGRAIGAKVKLAEMQVDLRHVLVVSFDGEDGEDWVVFGGT